MTGNHTTAPSDRVEKRIDLKAPVDRVWRAITDHESFGRWFGVALEGPFELGVITRGHITHPGYEHLVWESRVDLIEPERRFVMTWVPYAEPQASFAEGIHTQVSFTLTPIDTGTRLEIVETGFDALPDDPRWRDSRRMNEEGWTAQLDNIAAHVEP